MNRRENYADEDKWRNACANQRKRYYDRLYINSGKRRWKEEEIEAVMQHNIPDRELSKLLGRSVMAIHVKRSKVKKRSEKGETDKKGAEV